MPLSRLDNFLKNVRGNIIYVNPNDLDATDSVTNQGNSMGRPFITIQRALIEASRFSYQQGLDNDRFGKTTILLSPGEHVVDNRPGFIPLSSSNFRLRDGTSTNDFTPFSSASNFDLTSSTNDLFKLNSVYGGVIVPRGVSIVTFLTQKTIILKHLQFSKSLVDVTSFNLPSMMQILMVLSIETMGPEMSSLISHTTN